MTTSLKEKLKSGFERIDEDHKELFAKLEELRASAKQQIDLNELRQFITYFEDHALRHFLEEERYMEALGYAQLAAHQRQHSALIDFISIIQEQVDTAHPNNERLRETVSFLADKMSDHLRHADRDLTQFMRASA